MQVKRNVRDVHMPMKLVHEVLAKVGRLDVIPVNFIKGRFVIFNVVRKIRVDFKNFENIFVVGKLFET